MKSKQQKIIGVLSALVITGVLAISFVIGPARIRMAKADQEYDEELLSDTQLEMAGEAKDAAGEVETDLVTEMGVPEVVAETEIATQAEESAQSIEETEVDSVEQNLSEVESEGLSISPDIGESETAEIVTWEELAPELEAKLEDQIAFVKTSLGLPQDTPVINGEDNFQDVLKVYAARHEMLSNFPNEVEIVTAEDKAEFYSIYWEMNSVSGKVQRIDGQDVYSVVVIRDNYQNYSESTD